MIAPFVGLDELDHFDGAVRDRLVLADVRWYLDGRSGREAHAAGHLPGAVFIDLDTVLADPPTSAEGRHPLPSPERFAAGLSAAGIGDDSLVVAYDDAGGVIAARLVWMLRALGVEAAVLDGGVQAWVSRHGAERLERGATSLGAASTSAAVFAPRPWPAHLLADADETGRLAASGDALVLDARTADRYRGDTEPVDARPGHTPGALSFSCRDNVDDSGRLLPVDALRERLVTLGADEHPVVSYCGSGVTACHTLLVLEQAGLPAGKLYPGSWSQWSADLDRDVATGEPTAP